MARTRLPLFLLLVGAFAVGPRAEDVALVPLEGGAHAVLEGLEMVVAGRLRDGVAALQAVLAEEASASRTAAYLVEVPAELPRDLQALLEALRRTGTRTAEVGGLVPDDRGELPVTAGDAVPRDPLLAVVGGEEGRRFLPAADLARHCLSILPAAAMAQYRELYDGLAASVLAQFQASGKRSLLERLARELGLTTAGAEATELLADDGFLSARYAEALEGWRQLVRDRRGSEADQQRVHRKLVRALGALRAVKEQELERGRFLGRWPTAAADLGAADEGAASSPRAPEPPSRWGGELESLSLSALMPAPAVPPAEPLVELSWDTWSWALQGLGPASLGGLGRGGRFIPVSRLESSHFPFVPLADGDNVYLSGVFNLYRFDGRPGHGSLIASIPKPLPSPDLLQYQERPDHDSSLYTVTLWKAAREPGWSTPDFPDEVLITHYISDRIREKKYLGYFINVEIAIRSLVAFEARTGRVLWQTGSSGRPPVALRPVPDDAAAQLEPDDEEPERPLPFDGRGRSPLELDDADAAIARDFSYTSPALVRGGLVIVGGWQQRGYINSAVRALDLRTGKVVWEAVLGGSQVEPTMFGEMAREPLGGAIAEQGGVVYFLSQMGVVAALEARTGAVRWLATYDAMPLEATFAPRPDLRPLLWGPNPLLLLGNALICAPRDAERLYAFDIGRGPSGAGAGGRRLWSFPNPGYLRDVLGHAHGYLYLLGGGDAVGTSELTALDLRGLDAAGALPGGASTPERAGALAIPLRIPGRGALTRDGILFADPERLWLADLDLGGFRPVVAVPFRVSERGTYPGRLTVDGSGRVLMTSRSLLSAFFPAAAKSP